MHLSTKSEPGSATCDAGSLSPANKHKVVLHNPANHEMYNMKYIHEMHNCAGLETDGTRDHPRSTWMKVGFPNLVVHVQEKWCTCRAVALRH